MRFGRCKWHSKQSYQSCWSFKRKLAEVSHLGGSRQRRISPDSPTRAAGARNSQIGLDRHPHDLHEILPMEFWLRSKRVVFQACARWHLDVRVRFRGWEVEWFLKRNIYWKFLRICYFFTQGILREELSDNLRFLWELRGLLKTIIEAVLKSSNSDSSNC